ncbi:MAG: hypothetical protein GY915_02075, partial [bacterium]|nr:hypothetical protein [bacterium]
KNLSFENRHKPVFYDAFTFFHLDTALCPLSKGHVLAFPEGIAPPSYETLQNHVEENFLIPVTHEEALSYGCNAICWGDKVILPECGDRLPALLREKGYDVKSVDVSVLMMSGGGPHCLVNLLNFERP